MDEQAAGKLKDFKKKSESAANSSQINTSVVDLSGAESTELGSNRTASPPQSTRPVENQGRIAAMDATPFDKFNNSGATDVLPEKESLHTGPTVSTSSYGDSNVAEQPYLQNAVSAALNPSSQEKSKVSGKTLWSVPRKSKGSGSDDLETENAKLRESLRESTAEIASLRAVWHQTRESLQVRFHQAHAIHLCLC